MESVKDRILHELAMIELRNSFTDTRTLYEIAMRGFTGLKNYTDDELLELAGACEGCFDDDNILAEFEAYVAMNKVINKEA